MLTPHPLVKGFPTAEDRALGEHVRHMRNVHDMRLVELGNLRTERSVGRLSKALGSTAALARHGRVSIQTATSIAERIGGVSVPMAHKDAVELALVVCIDEALALDAGSWAARKIVRKGTQ